MSEDNQTFDISTVINDAKKIIFSPSVFYKEMPQTGGFVNPVIFVLVMAFIAGVIFSILSLFGSKLGGFGSIILFPIAGMIGSFIGAAILFVIWKLMGSEKDYEVAYRCVAYAYVIAPVLALISFVPYIAGIVKVLWGSVLMYIASRDVYGIKEQTAKLVFGILATIGVLWGLNAEYKARHWVSKLERVSKDVDLGKLENMTPEELGENAGKFLEGLNRALEEASKEK